MGKEYTGSTETSPFLLNIKFNNYMENKQILSNLVSMLKEYYTYPEEVDVIIALLCDDDGEERLSATIKAFGLFGKKRDVQSRTEDEAERKTLPTPNTVESNDPSATVHIDSLHNKLIFIKAVMDVTECGLRTAKNLVDSILIVKNGYYSYNEFEVGPKGKFSQSQWERISKQVSEGCNFEWHFV